MPKSVTTAAPRESNTFSGLMSRWTMPCVVRVGQRSGHIAQDADRSVRCGSAPRHPRSERLAAHVGHRVVGEASRVAGVEHRDDVRLLEPSREPYLAGETLGAQALGELGGDHLDDDLSAERGLVGDEDARHPTAAELALEGVSGAEGGLELVAEVGHRQGRPDVGEKTGLTG